MAYEGRDRKKGQTVQQNHEQSRQIPEAGKYGATKGPRVVEIES
jgi:hypothetical protein